MSDIEEKKRELYKNVVYAGVVVQASIALCLGVLFLNITESLGAVYKFIFFLLFCFGIVFLLNACRGFVYPIFYRKIDMYLAKKNKDHLQNHSKDE